MAAGATYTPIASYTVSGSSTNTYTFSSISGVYTDIIFIGSIATVTGSDTVAFRVNGDTTTNYSRTFMYGDGTTAASGRVSSESSYPVATLNTTFAPVVLNFNNYSNTTTYKSILYRGGFTYPASAIGLWRATPAAITSINAFWGSTANFASGSTLTLYGITAA